MGHEYIRKTDRVNRVCQRCGREFYSFPSYIKRGKAKHCSPECRAAAQVAPPLASRLWESVDKNGPVPSHCPELGPCWLWTGRLNTWGYGITQENRKNKAAHRVAYALTHGAISGDLFVLHRCDVRNCVNPAHLFLGTQQDNMDDMVAKGRQSRKITTWGETHHKAMVTADQVRMLRSRYAAGGVTLRELAAEYGVSYSTVRQLIKRITWRSVA